MEELLYIIVRKHVIEVSIVEPAYKDVLLKTLI
jgi:hypothetical protein